MTDRVAQILALLPDADAAFLRQRLGAAGPGQLRPETAAKLSHRNELVRAAAARWWPTDSTAGRARSLCTALRRYRESVWERQRAADVHPRPGTRECDLWGILKARDLLLSESHVRTILAADDC